MTSPFYIMKRPIGYILIFLLLTALCGCRNDVARQLAVADSIVCDNPDSALKILDAIPVEAATRQQNMFRALLSVKAKTKLHIRIEGDTLLPEIEGYFNGRGDSLDMQSKYYYGMALIQEKDYDKALTFLIPAYDFAKEQGDLFYQGLIAREISFLFMRTYAVEQQFLWARKEKQHFQEGGYDLYGSWADINIISSLIRLGHSQEALDSIGEVNIDLYNSDAYFRKRIDPLRASALHSLGYHEEAIEEYERIYKERGRLNAGQWAYLATDYLETGRLNKAEAALDSAYNSIEEYSDSIRVLYAHTPLVARKGNYKEAYELAWKFGVGVMIDDGKDLSSPATIPLVETLRGNVALERRLRREQREMAWLWGGICLMGVVILGLVSVMLHQRLKARRREAEAAGARADELAADLNLLRDRVARREEELGKRSDSMRTLLGKLYNEVTKVKGNFRDHSAVQELEALIDLYYDNRMSRFRALFPGLTAEQYELAMYTFLGLTGTSISMLLNKANVSSVYTAKSRLKEEIGHADSPEAREMLATLGF